MRLASFALLWALFASTQAWPLAQAWNGSVSNSWSNASNWTPGGLPPQPADDVTIPNVGANPYPSLNVTGTINSLTIQDGASLTTNGGFAVTNAASVAGSGAATTLNAVAGFTFSAGSFSQTGAATASTFNGAIAVTGNFSMTAGSVSLGTSDISVGAQLQVSGGTFTQAGATAGSQAVDNILVNGGTCTWGSGALTLAGGIAETSGVLNLGAKALSGVTSFSVTGGNITFSSVAMGMSGDLTVNTGGTVTAGAAITMNGAGNLAISTGPIGPLVINNAVTVTASGAGQDVTSLSFAAGSLAVGGFSFQASSAAVSQAVTVAAGGHSPRQAP